MSHDLANNSGSPAGDICANVAGPPTTGLPSTKSPGDFDWSGSVFFLFIELTTSKLSVGRNGKVIEPQPLTNNAMRLEASGTAIAISSTRFITCDHCIYNEWSKTHISNVTLCQSIIKDSSGEIVPYPGQQVWNSTVIHCHDVHLDYAVFDLAPSSPRFVYSIPICSADTLPRRGYDCMMAYFGALRDFQISELSGYSIEAVGPFAAAQYTKNRAHPPRPVQPEGCLMVSRGALCCGSSGGAIVSNGCLVAMHIGSISEGKIVWKHLKDSSITMKKEEHEEDLFCLNKVGLVLCRIPEIMNSIADVK